MPGEMNGMPGMESFGFAPQGEKRASSEAWDMSVAKVTRPDGESWTCVKCNSVNYSGRTVCFMRYCKAPMPMPGELPADPWFCPGCGNENFATRVFCNLRKCQKPRPNATFQEIQEAMQQGQGQAQGSAMPAVQQVSVGPDKNSMLNAKAASVEGSWQCGNCGTVNFPMRTHCNSNRCGRPREEVDAGPAAALMQSGAMVGQMGVQMGVEAFYSIPGPDVKLSTASDKNLYLNSKAASVEGSWQCGSCATVNFPGRTHCNSNRCGRPREEVDAGPPGSSLQVGATVGQFGTSVGQFGATVGQLGAEAAGFFQPAQPDVSLSFAEKNLLVNAKAAVVEGSWQCGSCGTVNFPQRSHCNSNKCARPREEVDAGPPAASLQSAALVSQLGASAAGIFAAPGSEAKLSTASDKNLYLNSKAASVEGSWQCGGCGTVNFPMRTHCNSNRCGRPREEVDAGPAASLQAASSLQACNMVGQLGTEAVFFQPTGFQPTGFLPTASIDPSVGMPVPDGSWICGACQNINFSMRTTCNGKFCGRPRCEVDGGPPALGIVTNSVYTMPLPAANSVPPEGSWLCPGCQNVNFSFRFTCNKRGCGLPRPS